MPQLNSLLKKGTVPLGSIDCRQKDHSLEWDSPPFQQASSTPASQDWNIAFSQNTEKTTGCGSDCVATSVPLAGFASSVAHPRSGLRQRRDNVSTGRAVTPGRGFGAGYFRSKYYPGTKAA